MTLLKQDFEFIRAFAKDKTAISIDADREHFIESRVGPVAEREGFESIQAMCDVMRGQRDLTNLHLAVIDSITTNETLFFRDIHPFDALKEEILPELITNAGRRKLLVWSAACSTGQEAYSLALLVKESFPALGGAAGMGITGTDLVERVLKKARSGKYTQHEVKRGLPEPLLARYFTLEKDHYTLREDVRAMAKFEQLNLIQSWPPMPSYDLVFLRNVLIYFEVEARRRILNNIIRHMAPGGYLCMGSAETPVGLCPQFEARKVGRAVFYRLTQ